MNIKVLGQERYYKTTYSFSGFFQHGEETYQGIQYDANERYAAKCLCPGGSHELGERRCRVDNDPVVGCRV